MDALRTGSKIRLGPGARAPQRSPAQRGAAVACAAVLLLGVVWLSPRGAGGGSGSWLRTGAGRAAPIEPPPPPGAPAPATVDALPRHLRDLGLRLFGSREGLAKVLDNMAQPRDVSMTVPGGVLRMRYVQAKTDIALNHMSFESDDYRLRTLDPEGRSLVVDVGSNIGDAAVTAALRAPKSRVLAFEPAPTTYFYLCYNAWVNGVPLLAEADLANPEAAGLLAVHGAAGARSGTMTVRWSDTISINAAVGTDSQIIGDWNSAEVPAIRLKDYLADHGVERVDVFKIDCEGCEFELIPDFESWLLPKDGKVGRVTGEIHMVLLTNTPTHAGKATKEQGAEMTRILEARGCKPHASAIVNC
ncbi:hypothetical protein Rsub_06425 [Raphidocelis subcapitata]|uniref:Methyltransferase FkbM domain-containing protein n=1 Tax=Raphidocelis subcapitata TaxID=307507 RepID=A0A2V0P8A2_9CHLO|nr:hypothetical protein Rsub_06425 [Raphidocelis subcapitata]|eukprot:GBF93387.1 hypothetical protein Rsub_06425 [Raphidocelis subcapitata]